MYKLRDRLPGYYVNTVANLVSELIYAMCFCHQDYLMMYYFIKIIAFTFVCMIFVYIFKNTRYITYYFVPLVLYTR